MISFSSPLPFFVKKTPAPKRMRAPHNARKLFRFFCTFFLAAFALAGLFFILKNDRAVQAAWFNDNWMYRQTVAIANTSGSAQTDYQVQITMNTSAIAGKIQTDCDDIRITDPNGKLLSYWIEPTTCNGAATLIWVKIPSIPTSGINLYIYYGNASATNKSSTTATFIREISGVQGAWKLDESSDGTGAVTRNDSSGNGNNLTDNNTTPSGTGIFSNAINPAYANNEYLSIADASQTGLDITGNITISAWINPSTLSDANGHMIVNKYNTSGNQRAYMIYLVNNSGSYYLRTNLSNDGISFTSAQGATAFATSTWYYVTMVYNGTDIRLYINGSLDTNGASNPATYSSGIFNSSSVFRIGRHSQDTFQFGGLIDEARIYNTALTTDEITSLYNNYGYFTTNYPNYELVRKFASTEPSAGSPSTEEQSPGPVAYWKFDEGTDNTCAAGVNDNCDSTQGANDLAKTNAVWQTENFCPDGKCLFFDGTGDLLTRADDADFDFVAADSFTWEAWVRHKPQSAGQDIIVAKHGAAGSDGGYKILMEADGDITCGIDDDDTWGPDAAATSTAATYDDNQWHHVTCVKNAAVNLSLYIDGRLITTTATDTVGSLANADALYIGIDGDGSSNGWDGFIDDVKMYRYVRTAAQIKTDYNSRGSIKGSSANLGNSKDNNLGTLINGLVGYWKMDEASGNAVDSSGNATTLTDGSTTTYANGKFANGADLELGSTDYLYAADNAVLSLTGNLTITAWIKPESVTAATLFDIVSKFDGANESYQLSQYGDEIRLYIGAAANYATTDAANLTAGSWYQVTAIYDAPRASVNIYINGVLQAGTVTGTIPTSIADNAARFQIGAEDTTGGAANYYDGFVDDIRVYDRALSPAEMSQLYNWAPGPAAWWKFDENTGVSANDSSGGSVTGTLNNGPARAPGKIGSGIDFDGVDSNVSFTSPNWTMMTIEGWVRADTIGDSNYPRILELPGEKLYFSLDGGAYDNTIELAATVTGGNVGYWNTPVGSVGHDGLWRHIAVAYDNTNLSNVPSFYINGVLQTLTVQQAPTGTMVSNSGTSYFGNRSTSDRSWDGPMDDMKIYNYIRTQKQVVEDMNAGHPAPGSPVGSAVGYFKFDEGADNTCSGGVNDACNSGSQKTALDATSTATRSNAGKFGKTLDFDGTDDVVTVADSTSVDLYPKTGYSVCGWIYPDTDGEGNAGEWFSKGNSYVRVDTESGATVEVSALFDLATTDATRNTVRTIPTTGYSHVCVTWEDDDDDELSIYINGTLEGSSTDGVGSAVDDTASQVLIGGDTTNNFDGRIDEVKIYNFALTAAEVKMDYNRSAAVVMGALSDNSTYQKQAANQEYCVPGDATSCAAPIGEWKLEEGSGTNAYDSSGNGNLGTITPGNGGYVPGKLGKAYNFDKATTVINAQSGTGLDDLAAITAEAWIYPKSGGENNYGMIIRKAGSALPVNGWQLGMNSTYQLLFEVDHSGTDLARYSSANSVVLNQWNHVTVVWDGSMTATNVHIYVNGTETSYATTTNGTTARVTDAAENLLIGESKDGNYTFDGYIDNVVLFNYVRTSTQINWDYNRGGPKWNLKMDQATGTTTTAYDSGPMAANGTLANNAVFDTTAGNCKFNYCVDLDGTNDYISTGVFSPLASAGGTTTKASFGGWYYLAGTTTSRTLLYKTSEFRITTDASTQPLCEVFTGGADWRTPATPPAAIPASTWTHIFCTYDGANIKTYINGVLTDTEAQTNTITAASSAAYVGVDSSTNGDVQGRVDEQYIFNYDLSATQVKLLYNQNSAVRFAPANGYP